MEQQAREPVRAVGSARKVLFLSCDQSRDCLVCRLLLPGCIDIGHTKRLSCGHMGQPWTVSQHLQWPMPSRLLVTPSASAVISFG